MTDGIKRAGLDPVKLQKRAQRLMEQKKDAWETAQVAGAEDGDDFDMEVDGDEGDVDMESIATSGTKGKKGLGVDRAPRGHRHLAGMATREQDEKAVKLRKFAQREPNRLAKASESDRHVPITRPKWMLSGKRKGGKTQRR